MCVCSVPVAVVSSVISSSSNTKAESVDYMNLDTLFGMVGCIGIVFTIALSLRLFVCKKRHVF